MTIEARTNPLPRLAIDRADHRDRIRRHSKDATPIVLGAFAVSLGLAVSLWEQLRVPRSDVVATS